MTFWHCVALPTFAASKNINMKKKYFIILLLAVGCMSALKAQPLSVVKKIQSPRKSKNHLYRRSDFRNERI